MNTTLVWRGDAVAVAQVVIITPGEIVGGRDYTLRINAKDITCQGGNAVALVDAFVDAINNSSIAEWREVSATSTADDDTEYGTFGDVALVLTSREAGVPFTVTGLVAGFEQRGAIVITIWHTPTGGTWYFDAGEVSEGGYGNATFDFNDSVGDIQTAMDGLFGAGNTLVSRRSYADPARVVYIVELIGSLAGKAVIPVTVDGSGLTGGNAALVASVHQSAVVGTDEVQTVTIHGGGTGGNRRFGFAGAWCSVAYNASAATLQTAFRALSTVGDNVDITGTANVEFVFSFRDGLGHKALPLVEIDSTEVTGGTIYADVTVTHEGSPAVNQMYYVYLRYKPDQQASITINRTTPGGWSAGAWTLHLNSHSIVISYDATPVEISGLIEEELGLPGICVTLANADTNYVIRFVGPLLDFQLTSVSVTSGLTGGAVSAGFWTSGVNNGTFNFGGAPSFTLELRYGVPLQTIVTAPINRVPATGKTTAEEIQAAIDAAVGAGSAIATGTSGTSLSNSAGSLVLLELTGVLSGQYVYINAADTTFDSASEIGAEEYQRGVPSGDNETVSLQVHGSPTIGDFTLSVFGQETAPIDYNDSASSVQGKLTALSSVTPTGMVATGGPLPGTAVTIVGSGVHSNEDLPVFTVNDNGLKATVVHTTPGVTGRNQVQRLSLKDQDVRDGTVTLTIEGDAVDPVAFDCDLEALIAELETSSGVTAGDLAGSYGGPWPESDYFIVVGGELAETNLDLITATDDLTNAYISTVAYDPLIIRKVVNATGPNHLNQRVNWYNPADPDLLRAPERGDTLIFTEGNVDVLYGGVLMLTYTADATNDLIVVSKVHDLAEGQVVEVWSIGDGGAPPAGLAANTSYYIVNLDPVTGNFALATTAFGDPINITSVGTGTQWIGVRVNRLLQWSIYTGKLGLPWKNADYKEYRPLDLEIGLLPGGAKLITIGQGDGSGSGRIGIFTGPDQVTFECLNSGGSSDRSRPAVVWRGEHTQSVVRLLGGDLGIAVRATEAAVFKTLEQRGGTISTGANVTANAWDKTAGSIGVIESAAFSQPIKIRG